MAVASAEPYASYLHFATEDNHASTSSLKIFTGRMHFLTPNQHRQSTERLSVVTVCMQKFCMDEAAHPDRLFACLVKQKEEHERDGSEFDDRCSRVIVERLRVHALGLLICSSVYLSCLFVSLLSLASFIIAFHVRHIPHMKFVVVARICDRVSDQRCIHILLR